MNTNDPTKMIYLDNAATTQMDTEVLNAMLPYMTNAYGNPGSLHSLGTDAKKAVDNSREIVAEFMGCDPENVIFTSGGSEANTIITQGLTDVGIKVYSEVEHPSIIKSMRSLGKRSKSWPVFPNGTICSVGLQDVLNRYDVGFLAAMYVNNEIGSVNDVEWLGNLCEESEVWFHTDCVQAAGNYKLDAKEFKCSSMSISSHKIHGPKGVGALYVREPKRVSPLIYGGQELGIRGGTENVSGIVGFAKACEISGRELERTRERIKELRNRFLVVMSFIFKKENIDHVLRFNGEWEDYSKTISFRIDGVDSQTMLMMMDLYGISASAGSACTSREMHPSHVLKAIGLTDEQAYSTIRISLSKYTTKEEIDEAAAVILHCAMSLLKKGG